MTYGDMHDITCFLNVFIVQQPVQNAAICAIEFSFFWNAELYYLKEVFKGVFCVLCLSCICYLWFLSLTLT